MPWEPGALYTHLHMLERFTVYTNERISLQQRVHAAYEVLHSQLGGSTQEPENVNGGPLAGQFIVSDSFTEIAEPFPLAALLSGACFLGIDADAEAGREMLRNGRCDFVVNSLDEALRILKNELRQRKPVAVCATGNVPLYLDEMADRGVAPQLLMHRLSPEEFPAIRQIAGYGARLYQSQGAEDRPVQGGNKTGDLTRWSLPNGNAVMINRLDALARGVLPREDRWRQRWLEAASTYLPREAPPSRFCVMTPSELERFADAVSARVMSQDVTGPVMIESAREKIQLN